MAGRRQHFIQQHLSRGFAIDPARRPAQVWVYRRDATPFCTATENYGAEKDFYSPPDDTGLDDAITAAESATYNPFINELRVLPSGSEVAAEKASQLVQHLLFRSKHIRSVFSAGLVEMLRSTVAAFFADRKKVGLFLQELMARHRDKLLTEIEARSPRAFTSVQRHQCAEMLRREMPQWVELLIDQQWPLIQGMVQLFVSKVPEMVAAGHRNALAKQIGNNGGARREALQSLEWRIWEFAEDLVLGDSCVFSELDGGQFRALADVAPNVRRHLVPISSRRCLVGGAVNLQPLACSLREGAARCSYDSFCTNADTEEGRRLQALIGLDAMPISADEIQRDGMLTLQQVLQEQIKRGVS